MKKYLCIIGPDETYTGGMLNVIHQIMESEKCGQELIKIHIGTASKNEKMKAFIKGTRQYLKLCRQHRVSIAHIQLSERGSLYRTIILLGLSRRFGVKTIIHSHGGLFFYHLNSIGKYRYGLIKRKLNYADRVVVLTDGWKELWARLVDESKIRVVPNGTTIKEVSYKSYCNDDVYNILFLGNINPIKGIYDLIDAIELLKNDNIPLILRIAGGDQIEECKKYVESKKLSEIVKVLGWIDGEDKEQLFRISDILVLPSYFESFGLVAIEAMAHKVPVICGDKGFTKEVIVPGKTGLICKTGDKIDIANTIKEMCNVFTIKTFALAGYKHVCQNYEIDRVMEKLNEVYKELI